MTVNSVSGAASANGARPAFLRRVRAGVLHQNLPHQPRGDGNEVRSILQLDVRRSGEPHPRLVHERRGLQRVIPALLRHLPGGDAPQLVVHQRQQSVEGSLAPLPPFNQETGELPFHKCRHIVPEPVSCPRLPALMARLVTRVLGRVR